MARIHFLNVKDGDCSVIQHDNGHVTVIDVSNAMAVQNKVVDIQKGVTESFSMGNFVKGNFHQKENPTNPIEYLNGLGVKTIFRYIQTHPDMDHMDGLKCLLDGFVVINFWDTENTKKIGEDEWTNGKYKKEDWDCYQKIRKSATSPKTLFFYDGSQDKYFAYDDNGRKTDDFLQILSPTSGLIAAANEAQDWNDSSYVILYCVQGRKMLFCGDADTETIKHLMENHKTEIKDIDVLMAPHHGRDSKKDFSFLDIMSPKLSLLGNAKSQYLAYDEWNKRNLFHLTNNQAGNVVLSIEDSTLYVYVENQKFADDFCQKKGWGTAKWNETNQAWYIGQFNKIK